MKASNNGLSKTSSESTFTTEFWSFKGMMLLKTLVGQKQIFCYFETDILLGMEWMLNCLYLGHIITEKTDNNGCSQCFADKNVSCFPALS